MNAVFVAFNALYVLLTLVSTVAFLDPRMRRFPINLFYWGFALGALAVSTLGIHVYYGSPDEAPAAACELQGWLGLMGGSMALVFLAAYFWSVYRVVCCGDSYVRLEPRVQRWLPLWGVVVLLQSTVWPFAFPTDDGRAFEPNGDWCEPRPAVTLLGFYLPSLLASGYGVVVARRIVRRVQERRQAPHAPLRRGPAWRSLVVRISWFGLVLAAGMWSLGVARLTFFLTGVELPVASSAGAPFIGLALVTLYLSASDARAALRRRVAAACGACGVLVGAPLWPKAGRGGSISAVVPFGGDPPSTGARTSPFVSMSSRSRSFGGSFRFVSVVTPSRREGL